jgi:hypothetical protein
VKTLDPASLLEWVFYRVEKRCGRTAAWVVTVTATLAILTAAVAVIFVIR